MNLEWKYQTLVGSLKLLGLPLENQKECLPDHVDVFFEVVDNVTNAFLLFPEVIENYPISKSAIGAVVRCYNIMTYAHNNDLDGLQFENGKDWTLARELAVEALEKLGEEKGNPNMDSWHYVEQ